MKLQLKNLTVGVRLLVWLFVGALVVLAVAMSAAERARDEAYDPGANVTLEQWEQDAAGWARLHFEANRHIYDEVALDVGRMLDTNWDGNQMVERLYNKSGLQKRSRAFAEFMRARQRSKSAVESVDRSWLGEMLTKHLENPGDFLVAIGGLLLLLWLLRASAAPAAAVVFCALERIPCAPSARRSFVAEWLGMTRARSWRRKSARRENERLAELGCFPAVAGGTRRLLGLAAAGFQPRGRYGRPPRL